MVQPYRYCFLILLVGAQACFMNHLMSCLANYGTASGIVRWSYALTMSAIKGSTQPPEREGQHKTQK